MPAQERLNEAIFFLDKLKKTDGGSDEFKYYLSAFLSSAMSVPDWLFYDYAGRFFDLTVDDRIDAKSLRLLAKVNKHKKASDFTQWWSSETGRIRSEPPGSILTKKRQVIVHRGSDLKLDFAMIEFFDNANSPVGVSAAIYAATMYTPATPMPASTRPALSVTTAYFQDYDSKSVIELCEDFVNRLGQYVKKASELF